MVCRRPSLMQAKKQGLKIIDLTCPFVGKAQRHAEALRDEGYQVVVVGEKEHPEVQSIIGYAGKNAVVIENVQDVDEVEASAPYRRCGTNHAILW